jgi:hypothetical protein
MDVHVETLYLEMIEGKPKKSLSSMIKSFQSTRIKPICWAIDIPEEITRNVVGVG